MKTRSLITLICLASVSVAKTAASTNSDQPLLAAYIHIEQCFDTGDTIAKREQSIRSALDRFKAAGLDTIVPYVGTTSGEAHYPSRLIDEHRFGDWDPIGVFVRGARERGLQVNLCIPVLVCGHGEPAGILKRHPDWALRGEDGKPVGGISPGHPEARKWIVAWLEEIVGRYEPDGLLLDYLRFPSQPTQLEPESAARFASWSPNLGQLNDQQKVQHFRELLLTELMGMISDQLRESHSDLQIAIYSWGHHVTNGHRLAQNWPVWAAKGYIDEVNVCGYWYPKSFPAKWGENHMQAFQTVLTESRRLLKQSGADTKLTFALGVKTSHGQVKTVVDVANYLRSAARFEVDGVTFFTWSYLEPFLPQLDATGVLDAYATGQPIEDPSTVNIQRGTEADQNESAADQLNSATDHSAATVMVATKNSSRRAQDLADFVGDGLGDQEEINAAIAALPSPGGTVRLAEGTYDIRKIDGKLGGVLIERSNVVLAGQGSATKLILAAEQNTNVIRIIGSGVHHVTIRDLSVDANRRKNSTGRGDANISHDRFEFCGIKGYCRDPRGPGAEDLQQITIRNCEVRNAHRLGIMLEGSNLRVLDNVLGNAGSDSVELLTGPGMIRGNYVEITEQTHVAIGSDRGNSIQMSDNIVHVKQDGKLDIGFRSWANSQRHVLNGNVLIVDAGGRCGLAMDLRGRMQTVTGNMVESRDPKQATRIRIGGGNTTLFGNILKNVIVEVNDTYDDHKPIILRGNILDDSAIEHTKGNLLE